MQIVFLNRAQLKEVLTMSAVAEGVAHVYRMKAQGKTGVWPLVSHEFEPENAVMDIRSGFVGGEIGLHGLKMLNNFPHNVEKGLPPFNGMLMVFDSATGLPLGVMDASYITCMRTGAASAIGAKALARPDSRRLTVMGAGKQAIYQVAAALLLLPQLEQVSIADPLSLAQAEAFVRELPARLEAEFALDCSGVRFEAAPSLADAVAGSDIVITITPSRKPVIQREWVKPGTHFSCIGADMEGKEELDPAIFRGARVFADDKPQCLRVGELELAVRGGHIREEEIAGELGQVLAGMLPGRTDAAQTTIFDATGLALLDLVTAKAAIDAAHKRGIGTMIEM